MTSTNTTDHALARVAVVIVSFESASTLPAALGALRRDRLAEVRVVDNASTDESVGVARAAGATVIARASNIGFGAAVDEALSSSDTRTPYVLVLNPDAVIQPADLVRLVEYLDEHAACALVGPRLFREGAPLTSAGTKASLATELRLVAPRVLARRLPDKRLASSYGVTGPVGYVEGACILIRRAALDAVGSFGPGWFLFYEELDLARRFAAARWTVDLCAEAMAEHSVAASRATTPMRGRPHLVAAADRYLERWHGRPAARTFRAVARANWWVQARRGLLPPGDHLALRSALAAPT